MHFEASLANCCIKATTSSKPMGWPYGSGNGVLLCNQNLRSCAFSHVSWRHVTGITKKGIKPFLPAGLKKILGVMIQILFKLVSCNYFINRTVLFISLCLLLVWKTYCSLFLILSSFSHNYILFCYILNILFYFTT